MLSTYGVGGSQKEAACANPGIVITMSEDYDEGLRTAFNLEIQGNHFGKIQRLIIEGCGIEFYSPELQSSQNSCTAIPFEHMWKVPENQKKRHPRGIAALVYFFSMLPFIFKVLINQLVHASGHGK
jgi:hypothetical protein